LPNTLRIGSIAAKVDAWHETITASVPLVAPPTPPLTGSEFPTIIPLEGSNDKVAIHAVCRENVFWETLESLKKAGASSLLVLPVEKMLV
jgi:ATP phosphoribosyltransferase